MPFWDRKAVAPADLGALASFASAITPDPTLQAPSAWDDGQTRKLLGVDDPTFTAFASQFAGRSFGGGLLRFQPTDGDLGLFAWNARNGWRDDWPSMPRSIAFASDWRGNVFVVDPDRMPSGERSVARLTIGTGEYEKLNISFGEFIGTVMPKEWRDLLGSSLFTAWLASGGVVPTDEQCVAHKVPLILGGSDDVSNLEVLSLRVWVSFAGQIYEQAKDLPPGTKITGFKISG
jgi:T6SS immunity protein Tdi1, C-terminal